MGKKMKDKEKMLDYLETMKTIWFENDCHPNPPMTECIKPHDADIFYNLVKYNDNEMCEIEELMSAGFNAQRYGCEKVMFSAQPGTVLEDKFIIAIINFKKQSIKTIEAKIKNTQGKIEVEEPIDIAQFDYLNYILNGYNVANKFDDKEENQRPEIYIEEETT